MKIDLERVERYQQDIINMAQNDIYHSNCPETQIDTLSLMVGELLTDNENGKNDKLIAFFTHVGRSLKELIKYRTIKEQNNGKS